MYQKILKIIEVHGHDRMTLFLYLSMALHLLPTFMPSNLKIVIIITALNAHLKNVKKHNKKKDLEGCNIEHLFHCLSIEAKRDLKVYKRDFFNVFQCAYIYV